MNVIWLEKIWIELAILTALLLSKVLGQEYNYNYGSYSYGDYQVPVYNGYNSQDNVYEQSQYGEGGAEGVHTIQCYSCHYHVKNAYPEGLPSCDDPFDELDVPLVSCAGPCGPKNDPTAPNKISCYTCHYHIRGSYPEGMAGCDDPFRKEEIPIVECVGPCGKIRHLMTDGNPDDYMVIRNCIPGCKERRNEANGNYQECCTEPLCNGANGTVTSVMSLTYMTGLFCLVISLFMWT